MRSFTTGDQRDGEKEGDDGDTTHDGLLSFDCT